MTIDEIKKELDLTFHDANICGISIDYVKEEAAFLIEIDLSDPERVVTPSSRLGLLKLTGLLYLAIDPPHYGFGKEYAAADSRLWITGDSSDFSLLKAGDDIPKLPEPLPENSFRHWFYVSDTNSLIYVAAMNAELVWKD